MSRINNIKKVNRAIDFQSINFFTDIDIAMEVNGKFLLLGEAKEDGKDLTMGQRLFLESIVRAWNENPNRDGLALLLTHSSHYVDRIPITGLKVAKWFRNGEWKSGGEMPLLEFVENLAKSWRNRDPKGTYKLLKNLETLEL